MNEHYLKYIIAEKNNTIISSITSIILKMIADDEDLSTEDALYILKESKNRVVSILAKIDQENIAGKNNE